MLEVLCEADQIGNLGRFPKFRGSARHRAPPGGVKRDYAQAAGFEAVRAFHVLAGTYVCDRSQQVEAPG